MPGDNASHIRHTAKAQLDVITVADVATGDAKGSAGRAA